MGLALAGWGVVQSLAGMGISALYPLTRGMTSDETMAAISASGTLHAATAGVTSGGMVLLFVLSPLWARTGLDRRIGLAAAAFPLLLAFVIPALVLIVGGSAQRFRTPHPLLPGTKNARRLAESLFLSLAATEGRCG